MLLIPQIYLKDNKVVKFEGTSSASFNEDPALLSKFFKDSGVTAVHIVDLNVPNMGASPNLPIIQKIHDEIGLAVYVGGNFKSIKAIEPFIKAKVELVILGAIAYQQPQVLTEACKNFPQRIAASIDVKAGKVNIPGWTVSANKSANDYAKNFRSAGVTFIFYSDVDNLNEISTENLQSTLNFCKDSMMRVVLTSGISDLEDIKRTVALQAPRLEGFVLSKAFYQDKIDISGATTLIADLILNSGNELTLASED